MASTRHQPAKLGNPTLSDNPVESTEAEEHVETPQRKRPRLENVHPSPRQMLDHAAQDPPSTPPPRSTSKTSEGPVPEILTPSTPNKVTLNYKHCIDSPLDNLSSVRSSESPASLAATRLDHDLEAVATSDTIDATAMADVQKSASPVIEIVLSESEAEDADDTGDLMQIDTNLARLDQLINDFPYSRRASNKPSLSPRTFARNVLAVKFDVQALRDLGLWLKAWLDVVGNNPRTWAEIYNRDPDFWLEFCNILQNLLKRRLPFSDSLNPHDISTFLFVQVLRLAAQFFRLDWQELESIASDDQATYNVGSGRFLSILEGFFDFARSQDNMDRTWGCSLWTILDQEYMVDPYTIQKNLLTPTSYHSLDFLSELISLTYALAPLAPMNANVVTPLLQCVRVVSRVFSRLEAFNTTHSSELSPDAMTNLCNAALRLSARARDVFTEDLDNPPRPNFRKELSHSITSLMISACSLDSKSCSIAFQDRFGNETDIEPCDRPLALGADSNMQMQFRFLAKGRMELRIAGTAALGEQLLNVWNRSGAKSVHGASDPLIRHFGDFLVRNKVVQYLLGADSHPQIISRSGNILGFLIVTGQWTSDMTDATWSTLTSSPDPRIRAEATHMVSSIIHSSSKEPVVLQFSKKMASVTADSFDTNMLKFLDCLMKAVANLISVEAPTYDHSDALQILLDFCIELIKDFSARRQFLGSTPLIQEVYNNLQLLSETSTSNKGRQSIYSACVDDIKAHTETAVGSHLVLRALIERHWQTDQMFLSESLQLTKIIAQDICWYTSSLKKSVSPTDSHDGLISRVDLLLMLLMHPATFVGAGAPQTLVLDAGLEQEVISCLIGAESIDFHARTIAWIHLSKFIKDAKSRNSFIERVMDTYVAEVDSELTVPATLEFLDSALAYKLKFILQGPDETESDSLSSLTATLWRITVHALEESVSGKAKNLLLSMHLRDDMVGTNPTKAHVALVARCVNELISSADAVRHYQSLPDNAQHPHLSPAARFTRTLNLLHSFILQIRIHPQFQASSLGGKSPSPPLALSVSALGDGPTVLVDYQLFIRGKDSDTQKLEVRQDMSLRELVDTIARTKDLIDVSLIYRGQPLPLDDTHGISVSEVAGSGLLIIRASLEDQDARPSKATAQSVVDEEVLKHFDIFCRLLDLPNHLSYAVFNFICSFPPHQSIASTILSGAATVESLFPAMSVYRTLYSLWAMSRALQAHVSSGPASPKFLKSSLSLLTSLLLSKRIESFDPVDPSQCHLVHTAAETFQMHLRELPGSSDEDMLQQEERVCEQLLGVMQTCLTCQSPNTPAAVYSALSELFYHSGAAWQTFTAWPGVARLHDELLLTDNDSTLRSQVAGRIISLCSNVPESSAIDATSLSTFFWHLISGLIIKTQHHSDTSLQFWTLASKLFTLEPGLSLEESTLRDYYATWSGLLLRHEHSERPGQDQVDHQLQGLAELLTHCVTHIKALKKPILGGRLALQILKRFLLPYASRKSVMQLSSNGNSPMVLHEHTRATLFSLVRILSETRDDLLKVAKIFQMLLNHESKSEDLNFLTEPALLLRSEAGFVGLENLTNTCYMNSLVAQLFMNVPFRNFILGIRGLETAPVDDLLPTTQALFANLLASHKKYAETGNFAKAIVPYDGGQLDVTNQMDVEEFYNLLFERWEAQMPDLNSKRRLRSFFGGKLITQIKSLDCEHVSERIEDCATIQCEVKGKVNLLQSLDAYVQGDTMEGDNKYKCESCGGRFVNAIKRSCIKDLPDSLIISLKRFDFDLDTLSRRKINDYFAFPGEIDMANYKLEYLEQPSKPISPDIFELTGVLVHSGGAESGHYYSLIKSPYIWPHVGHQWFEFNDIDVRAFDPSKLEESCFGGTFSNYNMDKPYNAYMLFYRRKASQKNVTRDAYMETSLAMVPSDIDESMAFANDSILRRFCLMSPATADFWCSVLAKMKEFEGGVCSENHIDELLIHEVTMSYIYGYLTRLKDPSELDKTLATLKKTTSGCPECCGHTVNYLSESDERLYDLLVHNTMNEVSVRVVNFIVDTLKTIKNLSAGVYGVSTSPVTQDDLDFDIRKGVLPNLIGTLLPMLSELGLHARYWDNCFHLIREICSLGFVEAFLIIDLGMFEDCLNYIHALNPPSHVPQVPKTTQMQKSLQALMKIKNGGLQVDNLLKIIIICLQYVDWQLPDFCEDEDRDIYTDVDRRKVPLLTRERALISAGTQQLHLIFKMLDISTAEMVGRATLQLMSTNLDPDTQRKLHNTIVAAIGEFSSECFDQPLIPAGFYSSVTQSHQDVIMFVDKAVNQLRDVEPNGEQWLSRVIPSQYADFSAQGAQHFLHFLSSLVGLGTSSELSSEQHYLVIKHINKLMPRFVPNLLHLPDDEICHNMKDFLHHEIVAKLPDLTSGIKADLQQIDTVNAMRSLLDKLIKILQDVLLSTSRRSSYFELFDMAETFMDWISELLATDVSGVYQNIADKDADRIRQINWRMITSVDWNKDDSSFSADERLGSEDDRLSDEYDSDGEGDV